jgi:hypothetical protein
MRHLAPEELIDAIDGTLTAARRAHLDTCVRCRDEVASLHTLVEDARISEVPEPSPLFWDHFSARVHAAIAEDAAAPRTSRWFEWPVLAPIATLAFIVVALVSVVPLGEELPAPEQRVALAASPSMDEPIASVDAEWMFLADLMSDLEVDAGPDTGIFARPGSADAAVLQLSSGEQQELMRLLREELRAGG